MDDASATAEGDLARTPLAHLLVYSLDRRLTGALFLVTPDGAEHVVRLVRGAPVKVKPGDSYSRLGQMLIEAGAIDEATLEAALATKGLLGDVLLLAGRVERDMLEKVAEDQFKRRMVRLFALPPATVYRYYDGHEALAEYGGDPAAVDPLALVWAGVRAHGEVSALMDTTLARLGEAPLRISSAATVSRFGLDDEDARILERLGSESPPVPVSGDLLSEGDGPPTPRVPTLAALCAVTFPGAARRLVYALLITRQIELGTGLLPVGAEVAPASSRRDLPSSASTAVARMALKSTVHRIGAAAPDAPGDGERAPVVARRMRNRGAGTVDDPSSDGAVSSSNPQAPAEPSAPPVSSVESVPAPDSGVVESPQPSVAVEAPPVEDPPEAPADRTAAVESSTLRSPIDAIHELRASAPDLEVEAAQAEAVTLEETSSIPPPAFADMSPEELFWLARECLAERDMEGALEACCAGLQAAPDDLDLRSLEAWARAQSGGADIKALAVQLDEVLGADEAHVEARYYRGMLRKRLGDEEGAVRDLDQVMTLSPEHEGASLALAAIEQRRSRMSERPSQRPSLFGKLFKR